MRVDSIRIEGSLGVALSSLLDSGGIGANCCRRASTTVRSGTGVGMRTYITSGDTGLTNFSLRDSGRKSAFAKRRRCVVLRFGSRGNLESRSLVRQPPD